MEQRLLASSTPQWMLSNISTLFTARNVSLTPLVQTKNISRQQFCAFSLKTISSLPETLPSNDFLCCQSQRQHKHEGTWISLQRRANQPTDRLADITDIEKPTWKNFYLHFQPLYPHFLTKQACPFSQLHAFWDGEINHCFLAKAFPSLTLGKTTHGP